jgi:CubicO group peptidase (beta-lactamase class C family)
MLIEAGKLRLDSRVFGPNSILGDDYPWLSIQQITVEHLLTHTAGGWGHGAHDPMHLNKEMNQRELIAWTLELMPLAFPPGESFAYSNFGYCILGRVIEKLTGRTYEQYIKDNILRRCGITDMQIGANTLKDRATSEVISWCGIWRVLWLAGIHKNQAHRSLHCPRSRSGIDQRRL